VRHCTERCGWNATKVGRRSSSVVILSYAQYCRYRAVQRRLETVPCNSGCDAGARLNDTVLQAIGRPAASVGAVARVMFCRSTFSHPDLDEHEFRRDLLSTSVCVSYGRGLEQWEAWPGSSGGGAIAVLTLLHRVSKNVPLWLAITLTHMNGF